MESLVDRIHALAPSCGPVRVVAVDGPAGSGKTTYALKLADALGGVRVVHSDDFPVPWDEGPGAWFHALESQVLEPLSRGRAGSFVRYDWVSGRYRERVEVPAEPVLIIEGVGTARRTAARFLAFSIWVEAPRAVRMRRVLERDGAALEPRWHAWFAAEDAWFAEDGTRARADLVVT